MSNDFPRIITLLRSERHISQKKAAADLGISQALLSHYEKGIRECGLEFVVRVADYYDVSCDYLLGRSSDMSGMKITAEELPEPKDEEKATSNIGFLTLLNKKLIINSVNVLYDAISKAKNVNLINEVSNFLIVSIYRMIRVLHSSNNKNPQTMFEIPSSLSQSFANAAMEKCEAKAYSIASGTTNKFISEEKVEITPVEVSPMNLNEKYPLYASSVLNLIKNAESVIKK